MDLDALEAACRAWIAHHAVLRSSFLQRGDQLVQQILPIDDDAVVEMTHHRCRQEEGEGGLDAATTRIIESDQNTPLQWGDCLLSSEDGSGLVTVGSGPLAGTAKDVMGSTGAYADLWVTATPGGVDGSTEIEMVFDEAVVAAPRVDGLLEALCAVVGEMHDDEGVSNRIFLGKAKRCMALHCLAKDIIYNGLLLDRSDIYSMMRVPSCPCTGRNVW